MKEANLRRKRLFILIASDASTDTTVIKKCLEVLVGEKLHSPLSSKNNRLLVVFFRVISGTSNFNRYACLLFANDCNMLLGASVALFEAFSPVELVKLLAEFLQRIERRLSEHARGEQ
jgi:hypothetical protein